MSLTVVEKHGAIVQRFHDDYVREMVQSAREELEKDILDLRKGIRWYQTSVRTQLEEIWESIRTNERLLDYVMEGTSALRLHGLENDAEEQRLIDKIVLSWSWCSRSCQIDKQLSERAPSIEFSRSQLHSNCWLVFVYLIQYIHQVK